MNQAVPSQSEPVNPPTSPVSPTPPVTSSSSKNWLIIPVVFLLALLAGASIFYFSQQSEKKEEVVITPSPTTMVASPTPTQSQTTSLPSDWEIKTSSACAVSVPVPPKKEPYYLPADPTVTPTVSDIGGFWRYEERKSDTISDKFFNHTISAVFSNPEAPGSGYVPGIVHITCGPNTNNLTTEQFVTAYAKQFTDGTFEGLEFKRVGKESLWKNEVISAQTLGGMFDEKDREYYFATPGKLYKVKKIAMSTNTFIKQTTDQIFTNLVFQD